MEVTYEVYTLEKDRWIIDSRYQKSEREKAIDEAKLLAKQPHIEATRVVRESYNSEDGMAREKTVFDSRPKEDQEGGASGGGAGDDGFDADFEEEFGGFDDDYGGSGGGAGGGAGGGIADEFDDRLRDSRLRGHRTADSPAPAPAPTARREARAPKARPAHRLRRAGKARPPQRQAGTQAAVRRRAMKSRRQHFLQDDRHYRGQLWICRIDNLHIHTPDMRSSSHWPEHC